MTKKRPQLKFLKAIVDSIVNGDKTLEVRPRSRRWIENFSKADEIDLTYGPRFAAPKVFARAKLEKVEVRPFESTTAKDLKRIARGWEGKTPKEFIKVHNEWYSKELSKGYPVAWIFFKVIEVYEL